MIEIRPLHQDDDMMAVSDVYEQSWKYAYRGIVPDAYLDSIPAGRWAGSTCAGKAVAVVEDGRIIGVSMFSPARDENMPGYGEIISLYLLPEAMGKGHGLELMKKAVSCLNEMGFSKIYLWVLEENLHARKFYERFGFEQSGRSMTINIGGKLLVELQYVMETGAKLDNICTNIVNYRK